MYGAPPKDLGRLDLRCEEMLFYQDMPVKLAGQANEFPEAFLEHRLDWMAPMLRKCMVNYIATHSIGHFIESYVYVSAKHLWQAPGCAFNRPGWHCDGFGTNDINYIWSNCSPTVFNVGKFDLPEDDWASMEAMALQADPANNRIYPDCHVLRLDQYNVHRVADVVEPQLRTFVKISFSKDKYDLQGNAVNPMLDYEWEMRPRSAGRNMPQEAIEANSEKEN